MALLRALIDAATDSLRQYAEQHVILLNARLVSGLGGFEDDGLGKLLPFAVVGHFDGASRDVLQDVGGVVDADEVGTEVFAAVVVDELDDCQLVVFDLARGDGPAEGVVELAQIAGQLAVECLTGHLDVLVVEIDLQVDIKFFVE